MSAETPRSLYVGPIYDLVGTVLYAIKHLHVHVPTTEFFNATVFVIHPSVTSILPITNCEIRVEVQFNLNGPTNGARSRADTCGRVVGYMYGCHRYGPMYMYVLADHSVLLHDTDLVFN